MEKKVLLADDHALVRRGLKLIFQTQLGYKDVGEASSCEAVLRELETKKYSHLVLDINLGDGNAVDILGDIHRLYPRLQIAIVSMQPRAIYERLMRRYGIGLYISKSMDDSETIRQLTQFLQSDQPAKLERQDEEAGLPVSFTTREVEIMNYLLQGMRTNDIAAKLNLKGNTISTVKNRIFEKTNTSNLIDLKEYAIVHKII